MTSSAGTGKNKAKQSRQIIIIKKQKQHGVVANRGKGARLTSQTFYNSCPALQIQHEDLGEDERRTAEPTLLACDRNHLQVNFLLCCVQILLFHPSISVAATSALQAFKFPCSLTLFLIFLSHAVANLRMCGF